MKTIIEESISAFNLIRSVESFFFLNGRKYQLLIPIREQMVDSSGIFEAQIVNNSFKYCYLNFNYKVLS